MRYDVDADVYEGPLPLLVELARLNLIDLFLIQLVDLTQQYRTFLKSTDTELNELSEPLPLLSHLMALKARALLPSPPAVEEDEVPISLEELERRLREYEQFKTVAQLLAELHALQHQHFSRPRSHPLEPGADVRAGELAPSRWPQETSGSLDVGLLDLMTAFAEVLGKATAPVYEVEAEPWTIEMKSEELRLLLTIKRQVRFTELFTAQKSTLELVVIFLALLELIRQRLARAIQERPFSDILIVVRDIGITESVHSP